MRAKDIKIGHVYEARVSGKTAFLRVMLIDNPTTPSGRVATRYHCKNLNTGRTVIARSAAKFRRPSVQHDETK